MKQFTSFICSLEHLDGPTQFEQLKKREMMKPVDITFENKYLLKRELETVSDSTLDPRIPFIEGNIHSGSVLNRQRHDSAGA